MIKEGEWEEKYVCDECGMTFHYKKAYTDHLIHHNVGYKSTESRER